MAKLERGIQVTNIHCNIVTVSIVLGSILFQYCNAKYTCSSALVDSNQADFLFGKTGIFCLGLQKNEFEYGEYCQFLYHFFVTFIRQVGPVKKSKVTPSHCHDAVRTVNGILDGLSYLCQFDSDGKFHESIGKIFKPLYIVICEMTKIINKE